MMHLRPPAPPLNVGMLKKAVRAGYQERHPFRLAVEALPDTMNRPEFRAAMRMLLPLTRRGD